MRLWGQIAGLRNRIVHDYFGLDLEIILAGSTNLASRVKTTAGRRRVRINQTPHPSFFS
jgi:uncharacterized protein YutE (UPF0331/DUF86 family)